MTTVVAVVFGWLAFYAEKQRRAVETLEKHHALIFYDHYTSNILLHWRCRVSYVQLYDRVSESDVEALQALSGLEEVSTVIWGDELRLRTALPNCRVVTEIGVGDK